MSAHTDWPVVLEANTDRSGECWVWTGRLDHSGYAMRGDHRIGRVVYELEYGPVPKELWVLHHCDNPPCVRPSHLFIGTQADNMADMVAKGRQNNAAHGSPGERNPRARLTAAQVIAIRQATGTHREVGEQFGIARETTRDIRRRRRWRSLP